MSVLGVQLPKIGAQYLLRCPWGTGASEQSWLVGPRGGLRPGMAAGGQTGYLMASKMMAKHPCWGDWILPWITTLKGKWMEVMVVVQQMLLNVYIMVEPKYSEQPECWYAVLFTGPDCLPWALQSPKKVMQQEWEEKVYFSIFGSGFVHIHLILY